MLITGLLALLAALALGFVRQAPWPVDIAWQQGAATTFDGDHELLRLLVLPSEAVVLLPAIAGIALLCLLDRDRSAAVLAVAGPAVAVTLNSLVLKPVFRAYSDNAVEYPSGHTTSLVAVCTVLVLLARPGVARAISVGVGVVVVAAAGVGMVAYGYHYPLDIVGGCAVGVGVVLLAEIIRRRRAPAPSTG
ncbi:phosphatase PAP2 family protein [Thermocrispum municipale]|uniref:phosphatase PAP2 family protein n=1 Tax=Thermocrispum municipale TaxID=37926 RepID=UPI000422993C|nr:phosphatase PAP2 family protein [Thermocrispum municipale]